MSNSRKFHKNKIVQPMHLAYYVVANLQHRIILAESSAFVVFFELRRILFSHTLVVYLVALFDNSLNKQLQFSIATTSFVVKQINFQFLVFSYTFNNFK